MTLKEAKIIKEWLADNSSVKAHLIKIPSHNEYELILSKKNERGEIESLVIGLPITQDANELS